MRLHHTPATAPLSRLNKHTSGIPAGRLEQSLEKEITEWYEDGFDVDKFEKIEYTTGNTGVPIVTQESIAWFECSVEQTVDAGSHLLFIGKALNFDLIDENRHLILKSVHPSPFSARKGFFGSKPFTKTNNYLTSFGKEKINWDLNSDNTQLTLL